MEHKEDVRFGKLKATISIMYGILVWIVRLSSTIKIPNHYYLGTIISSVSHLRTNYNRKKDLNKKSPVISPSLSFSSSSSSFASSSTGDFLGSESGVYLSSFDEAMLGEPEEMDSNTISCFRKKKVVEKGIGIERDFPPPLTTLSTESSICRVPWVFDRYCVDGRLIVTETRARCYKHLETYRENGRLVMNLVPLDVTFGCCHSDYESNNVDLGSENDEICGSFSSDFEGEENEEIQEAGAEIKENEFPILESPNEKICSMDRDSSLFKSTFFGVPTCMNKPIHI